MKRFLAGLLIVGSVLSNICIGTFAYIDVSDSDWFGEVVTYSTDKGYFSGVGNDQFDPGGKMTRGMFVTALKNVADINGMNTAGSDSTSFTDVDSNDWFSDAVVWATKESVVAGYGNGKFGPNDEITREQMAVIMYRFAEYMGISLQNYDVTYFSDKKIISDWAYDAVYFMACARLILGNDDGTFNPAGVLTRAQAATVIVRMINPEWDEESSSVIYDANGLTIMSRGIYRSSPSSPDLDLYYVNNSDRDLMIQVQTCYVNGGKESPIMSTKVLSGKKTFDAAQFYYESDIEEIEIIFVIVDPYTYATLFKTDTITITF